MALAASAVVARADVAPRECLHVTAADAGDAAELRHALVTDVATVPAACLDVALVGLDFMEDGAGVSVTARVSVVVSLADHVTAIVAGRATLRASKRDARMHRVAMLHDVIDEAVASVMPALRARGVSR
jgi:hypothetical protein